MNQQIKLKEVIEKLLNEIITDSEIESVIVNFQYLSSIQDRPEYSNITIFIYQLNDDDDEEKLEILQLNLNNVIKKLDKEKDHKVSSYVRKIIDHINLAKVQKEHIDKTSNIAEERLGEIKKQTETAMKQAATAMKQAEIASTSAYNAEQRLKEIQDLKSKIYAEFVTILGIFATIIFASFGGLNILSNVLGNIEDVRVPKLMIFSSITLAGIILVLFLLLNSIARLTGLNLRSCGCSYEETCKHNIYQRHPTIMLSNLVLFYILIVGVIAYFLDYNLIAVEFNRLADWLKLIITFTFLISLGLILLFRFRYMIRQDISSK